MYYAGIDLHRKYLVVTAVNKRGERLLEQRLPNDAEQIRAAFRGLGGRGEAVVEAMGTWPWLVDLLEEEGIPTTLAHPRKVRAIAEARLKNDRVDAGILAHLLRTGLIPAAYAAPPAVRELRDLLRYRAVLVRMQTRLKNRLRTLLAKQNLTVASASLMTKRARAELATLPLPAAGQRERDQALGLLDHLAGLVRELDGEIRRRARDDPRATLLMTVPGIGFYVALLILAEIGDVARFPSARKLASYAGLVPTTRSSGDHTDHGRITKEGSAWLRWALVDVAFHVAHTGGPFARFYARQHRRKGPRIARVALARKLVTQVYWMLRNNEPYDALTRRLEAAGVSSRCRMA
jgi:transposase